MNDTPIMRVWGPLIPSDGRHDAVIGMARLLALSPDPRIQLHLVDVRSVACLLQKAGLGTPTPFQQPLPPLACPQRGGNVSGKACAWNIGHRGDSTIAPYAFQQPLPPLLALSAAGTCLGKPVRGTSGIGAIVQ